MIVNLYACARMQIEVVTETAAARAAVDTFALCRCTIARFV